MNKICTSIEQSKKLIELGIDVNSADLTVTNYPLQDGSRFDFIRCKLPNDTFPSITDGKSEKIPAWSLSVLLKLLPSEFEETGSFGTFKYKIDIRKYKSTDEMDVYQIAYGNYLIGNSMGWKDMINTGWMEDLLDAAFEMILKLNELNLL
jgi:hypothetical protein